VETPRIFASVADFPEASDRRFAPMTDQPVSSPNAREVAYWNSPATRSWAEHNEPIDRLFVEVTQIALDLAAPQPGERVIDVGCGSGTTVLELAARVGRGGAVLGADIAKQSVQRANERIAAAGLAQAKVVLADASTHQFELNSFDLLFSRFGVMFFSNPAATFANLRKAMKPSGRLTVAVFRTAGENRWAREPVASLGDMVPPQQLPGPEEPGQFSWADPARVRRILETAGFRDVSLTPFDPALRLSGSGGAADAADFAMLVGPVVRATLNASAEQRQAVRGRLVSYFRSVEGPQGVVLPGAIWIVKARA
jgi:SAM-dependent methyltransferase